MQTKVKNLIYMIIGIPTFLAIWIYNMFSGLTLLVGFGFGLLLFNWLNSLIKNYQKSIYLSEKADMQHRKLELEKELERLKGEVKDV